MNGEEHKRRKKEQREEKKRLRKEKIQKSKLGNFNYHRVTGEY